MMIPLSLVAQAHDSGLCVIPPAQDGSKRPSPPNESRWKQYQEQRPPLALLNAWYDPRNGLTGIGVVTGKVSGNLECIDFDTRESWEAYREMGEHCGILPLIDRVWGGYGELSPGGAHLLYRCPTIAGNVKLAMGASGKTLIETRGEGGYVIIAPSNGAVHPTRGEYRQVSGSLSTILTISETERKDLWELAKSLDQAPRQPEIQSDPLRSGQDPANKPGADFNRRASWPDVLEPHGWKRLMTRGSVTYWRRPGKSHGVSATTGYADTDYLYVFTSSTPLENERAYTKFSVYGLLEHHGDFKAAALALGKAGYGEPQKRALQPHLRSVPPASVGELMPPFRDSQGEAAKVASRPPLISLEDYIARPRAYSYLIKGVVPAVGLGQLFGDSNVGKTFIAIDIGCHIALGLPWRGRKVKKTGVLYVAAEGLSGLQARLFAWCQQMGEVPDRFWIREYPVGLTIAGAAQALADEIVSLPFPVGLIILDTFAGNFGVGSENDAADMAAALVGMKILGDSRMVLNIHHTGHADKTRGRGHSSLFAAIDIELLAARQNEDGPVIVSHTKARDFERMNPVAFRIEPVSLPWADEDGEPVNSAVAMPADGENCEALPAPGKTPSRKEERALSLLVSMYSDYRANVGASGTPRVKLIDWYQSMDFETDKGNRSRLKKGLENKGLIYCDSGYVYVS